MTKKSDAFEASFAMKHLAGKPSVAASQLVLDMRSVAGKPEAQCGDADALQSEIQLLRQQLACLLAALGCACCYIAVRLARVGSGR